MKFIPLLTIIALIVGCADDIGVRSRPWAEPALSEAIMFWQEQGYPVSIDPHGSVFLRYSPERLDKIIPKTLAIASKQRTGISGKTHGVIHVSTWFFQIGIESRALVLAHEIGHKIGFNHVDICPSLMHSELDCLTWRLHQ